MCPMQGGGGVTLVCRYRVSLKSHREPLGAACPKAPYEQDSLSLHYLSYPLPSTSFHRIHFDRPRHRAAVKTICSSWAQEDIRMVSRNTLPFTART